MAGRPKVDIVIDYDKWGSDPNYDPYQESVNNYNTSHNTSYKTSDLIHTEPGRVTSPGKNGQEGTRSTVDDEIDAAISNAVVNSAPKLNYTQNKDGTVNIDISAPQSYFDSTYYQKQVKPILQQFVGKNATSTEVQNEFEADVPKVFDASVNAWSQRQYLESKYGKMSDDEANAINQMQASITDPTSAAASSIKNPMSIDITDQKSGLGEWLGDMWDGGNAGKLNLGVADKQQTWKEALDNFNKLNTNTKAEFLKGLDELSKDSNQSPYVRALSEAARQGIYRASQTKEYKNMLKGKGLGMQLESFNTNLYNTFNNINPLSAASNKVGNALDINPKDEQANLDAVKEQGITGGGEIGGTIGALAGAGAGLFAQAAAAGGISTAANAALRIPTTAAKGGAIAGKLPTLRNTVASAFGGGLKNTTSANKLTTLMRWTEPGTNLTIGGVMALNPADTSYRTNPGGSFVADTLMNAAGYGAFRGLGKASREIGQSVPGIKINNALHKLGYSVSGTWAGKKLGGVFNTPEELEGIRAARKKDIDATDEWLAQRKLDKQKAAKAGKPYKSTPININKNYEGYLNSLAGKRADALAKREEALKEAQEAKKAQKAAQKEAKKAAKKSTQKSAQKATQEATQEAAKSAKPEKALKANQAVKGASIRATIKANQKNAGKMSRAETQGRASKAIDKVGGRQMTMVNEYAAKRPEIFGNEKPRAVKKVDENGREVMTVVHGRQNENLIEWGLLRDRISRVHRQLAWNDAVKRYRNGGKLSAGERKAINDYISTHHGRKPSVYGENKLQGIKRDLRELERRWKANTINAKGTAQDKAMAKAYFDGLEKASYRLAQERVRLGIWTPEQFKKWRSYNRSFDDVGKDNGLGWQKWETIGAHDYRSQAKSGRQKLTGEETMDSMNYIDPAQSLANQARGVSEELTIRQAKSIQDSMVSTGDGFNADRTANELIAQDKQLQSAFDDVIDELNKVNDKFPGAFSIQGKFKEAFTRDISKNQTLDDIKRQASEITDHDEAINNIASSEYVKDMQTKLDADSPASKFREKNPKAFVNPTNQSVQDVMSSKALDKAGKTTKTQKAKTGKETTKVTSGKKADVKKAVSEVTKYAKNKLITAGNPNIMTRKSTNVNIVNAANEDGSKFLKNTLNSIPDSLLNKIPEADKNALFDFVRGNGNLKNAVSNLQVKNYLESKGIHWIQDARGNQIQIASNSRVYDTTTGDDALKGLLSQGSFNSKENNSGIRKTINTLTNNYTTKMMADDGMNSQLLKLAMDNDSSSETMALNAAANNKGFKEQMANYIYENSPYGKKAVDSQVDSLIFSKHKDLAPRGWKDGDPSPTLDDYMSTARIKKDGTPYKQDANAASKKYEQYKALFDDKDIRAIAEQSDHLSLDDIRGMVDVQMNKRLDDSMAFDSAPSVNRQILQENSRARSEVDATGGVSKRDLEKPQTSDVGRKSNISTIEEGLGNDGVSDQDKKDLMKQVVEEIENGNIKGDDSDITSQTLDTDDGSISTLTADDDVTSALNSESAGAHSDGAVSRMLQMSSSFWRAWQTELNPPTWYKNGIRDAFLAMLASGENILSNGSAVRSLVMQDPANALGFIKSNPSIWDPIVESLGSADKAEKFLLEAYQQQATAVGGIMSSSLYGVEPRTAFGRGLHKVKNFLEIIPNREERAVRQSTFSSVFASEIERGMTPDDALTHALFASRNATTDFSMGLNKLQTLRKYTPYISAAINGSRSFYRMASLDPVGFSLRIATGVVAPIFYLTMSNMNDPKKKDVYERIPDYIKDSNAVFITRSGDVILLPLNDETKAFTSTTRRFVEFLNGNMSETMGDIFQKGFLDLSPVDIEWVANLDNKTDKYGQKTDFWDTLTSGLVHSTSSFMPPVLQAAMSMMTGKGLYYGDSIANYSNEGGVYDAIANIMHLPMDTDEDAAQSRGRVQTMLENIIGTGAPGKALINAIDGLLGVPEYQRGGRKFADTMAAAMGGSYKNFDAAKSDFYSLVDTLQKQKDKLKTKLTEKDKAISKADNDDEKNKLKQERQKLIDDYMKNVSTGLTKWQQLFETTGGIDKSRKNQLINLLNLGSDTSLGSQNTDTWQGENANNASYDEYNQALQRYQDLGIPDPTPAIMPYIDENGNYALTDESIAMKNATNNKYGAPKAMVYDVEQAVKGQNGEVSLWDLRNDAKDKINAIYDEAKRKGTKVDYKAIEKVQREYLDKFDERMKPIINRYGTFVMTNNDVAQSLEGVLNQMIPSSEYSKDKKGRFRSMPMEKANTWKWLQKHYGIGYGNTDGMPSDSDVSNGISKINEAIRNGRIAQARALATRLNSRIGNGSSYANKSDMNVISNILDY